MAREALERSNERQMEAAIYVLTARASKNLDIPVLDSLFYGPQGRKHVMANIRDEILYEEPPPNEQFKKRSSKKRGSSASLFDPFFPEEAYKSTEYTTKVPRIPPPWLLQLLNVIKDNAGVDEIFRKPGNSKRLKELMLALNKGEPMDFRQCLISGDCTVHDLVSLLKSYINHFEDPLIPHYQNSAFKQTTGIKSIERRIEAFQILTLLCPSTNRLLLQRLFECLHAVHTHCAENRMNAENLAVCVAPSIIRQSKLRSKQQTQKQLMKETEREKDVVQFMLQHANEVFQKPSWLFSEIERTERDLMASDAESAPALDASEQARAVSEPTVARLVQSNGLVVSDVTHVEYMQAVKVHTEMELAKLYESIKDGLAATPDEGAKTDKKKQQQMRKIARKMEHMGMPGTPAAHLPRTVKKTPRSVFSDLGNRMQGLVLPKATATAARLAVAGESPGKATDAAAAAACCLDPSLDESNEPPVWRGFSNEGPQSNHRETIV